MDGERRRRLAREVLDGYVSGPDAPVEATAAALARSESARAVVLVEGISDQIALETLAGRQGRELAAEGIVIVPIGGAHAITRYLVRFGPSGDCFQCIRPRRSFDCQSTRPCGPRGSWGHRSCLWASSCPFRGCISRRC